MNPVAHPTDGSGFKLGTRYYISQLISTHNGWLEDPASRIEVPIPPSCKLPYREALDWARRASQITHIRYIAVAIEPVEPVQLGLPW